MFARLKEEASTDKLKQLCKYIEDTWLNSTIWKPKDWSVFMLAIRTNNDCEGWHRRINIHEHKASRSMYLLFEVLHEEAITVKLQVQLLCHKKLQRHQRKKYREIQGKIFDLWEQFNKHDITTTDLLRQTSRIYAPVMQKK